MSNTFDFDLFIIGAGSGGMRAGRIAAGYGAKVAVAEEHRVGGTCVIRGCIAKKLLVYGAHFAEDLKDARAFGWAVPDCKFEWTTLRDNVLSEVDRLNGLYSRTLTNHNICILHQRAAVTGPHSVRLANGQEIFARYILIATGARPVVPNIKGAAFGITSNEVFHLPNLPKRIVIAGGGYIANEFAGIFRELSSEVTLLNRSGTILRSYDESIRDRLIQISISKGIEFRFNTSIASVEKTGAESLELRTADGDTISCNTLLFALGRIPNTESLGLDSAGVQVNARGAIRVDDDSKSTCDSIYAVGDVTDRIQLTPVAVREGHAFADTLFGAKPRRVDYHNIPSAVFSQPPIAAVGLTESQARNQLASVKVYSSDFRAMKNVLANRQERALYKMIVDATNDKVVGLHMIGPDAPEILQAAAIAVKAGLTKQAFDDTVALHPSIAEELVLMK